MERLGYREVRTPYVEPTPLFVRTIGEATDVVEKEMYSFDHHDEPPHAAARGHGRRGPRLRRAQGPQRGAGHALVLPRADVPRRAPARRAATASSTRSARSASATPGPGCDAEMIDVLVGFLVEIGIPKPDVLVNSIGSAETRAKYREALVAYLEPMKDDAQRRLAAPPRDEPAPHPRLEGPGRQGGDRGRAHRSSTSSSDDDRAHWDGLRRHLDALGTPYAVDPKLVRGLDYYTRTLFEIKGAYDKLGAGSTLVGGGRYDGMVDELGGPDGPGDRLRGRPRAPPHRERGRGSRERRRRRRSRPSATAPPAAALVLGRDVRKAGVRCEVDTRKASMKAQLRRANSLGARFAVILGDRELDEGIVELKDLAAHSQEKVRASRSVARRLVALLAARRRRLSSRPPRSRRAPAARRQAGRPDAVEPDAQQAGRPAARREPRRGAARRVALVASARRAHRHRADRSARDPRGCRRPHRHRLRRTPALARRLAPPLVLPVLRGAPRRLPPAPRPAALPRAHARPRPEDRRDARRRPIASRSRRSSSISAARRTWTPTSSSRSRGASAIARTTCSSSARSRIARRPRSTTTGSRRSSSRAAARTAATSTRRSSSRRRTGTRRARSRSSARTSAIARAKDVDRGVAPFWFHGDNGDEDGARKTYTLIPPLLYFHRERELEQSQLTVVGPVISKSDPKRSVFDVAPLLFTINGQPETGGVKEFHYTLFPLFHYGRDPEKSLFVLPGYLRRVTRSADTLITPFFTHATTRNKSTSLTMVGPIVPIYYRYDRHRHRLQRDRHLPVLLRLEQPDGPHVRDAALRALRELQRLAHELGLPDHRDQHATRRAGRSTSTRSSTSVASERSTHTVLAPILWDFASPKGRTTIGFPLFWRFADTADDSVTQVALNTLYRQKRVPGGLDWQFHLLPVFSYGQSPTGSWANLFFGLARLRSRRTDHEDQGALAADHGRRRRLDRGAGPSARSAPGRKGRRRAAPSDVRRTGALTRPLLAVPSDATQARRERRVTRRKASMAHAMSSSLVVLAERAADARRGVAVAEHRRQHR